MFANKYGQPPLTEIDQIYYKFITITHKASDHISFCIGFADCWRLAKCDLQ